MYFKFLNICCLFTDNVSFFIFFKHKSYPTNAEKTFSNQDLTLAADQTRKPRAEEDVKIFGKEIFLVFNSCFVFLQNLNKFEITNFLLRCLHRLGTISK